MITNPRRLLPERGTYKYDLSVNGTSLGPVHVQGFTPTKFGTLHGVREIDYTTVPADLVPVDFVVTIPIERIKFFKKGWTDLFRKWGFDKRQIRRRVRNLMRMNTP